MSNPKCPKCGGKVEKRRRPQNYPLKRDQWESQLAGIYICQTCPSNDRGNKPLCYWWKSEVFRKEQFDEFHDANPGVMTLFVRFTNELRAAGKTKIRADEVLHRVRWELLTTGEDFSVISRLKTIYSKRYAMDLMTMDASSRGLFDLTVGHDV